MQKNRGNKKRIILCCFVLILFFSGCLTPSTIDNEDKIIKDTLVFGVLSPETIYPLAVTNDNFWTIVPNIFDGLVEFDEDFRILPCLAVSWNNPDELTWRFSLRQGVQFHNGDDFTADDVKYSFDYIAGYSSSFNSIVRKVSIIDTYTIEVETYEPIPGFLERLAHSGIIYCKNGTEQSGDQKLIGTGAYQLGSYDVGNYTTLERFDGYWGQKAEIKTVIFRAITDDSERLDALLSGIIDIAEYNIDEKFDQIKNEDNISLVTYPPLSTYMIGFDTRVNGSYGFPDGKNPTADVRVRKAIYQAIDVVPLINGPFKGLAQPESQLVTPFIFGYNPEIQRFPYDINASKQLLSEAGYDDGFDIVLDCITEGYEYNAENCRLICQQLSNVGIHLKMNNLSVAEYNTKVVSERNTSMYLVGWGTISVDGGWAYDLFIRSVGESVGSLNSGYYSNPEVDRLGIAASHEMDAETRLELLQDGFRIALVDDVAVVPLFSQELFVLTATDVDMVPRADLRVVVKDIKFV
jgi:peptide/nickel transport system substrate-binding protein